MMRKLLLKTKGDPWIVNKKIVNKKKHPMEDSAFEDCGVLLEQFADYELQNAIIAANINILRREAPYAYFFATGVTLDEWLSGVQNDPYLKSFHSKQLQRAVWLTTGDQDYETTTVVTAVLSGDILPLARSMQEAENCLVCLPNALTLDEIDMLFAKENGKENGSAAGLEALLADGGFLLYSPDLFVLQVKTYDAHILEYFAW